MWNEKPGRPERPEVLGVTDNLEGVARDLAGAPRGGTPPSVIMEEGDSPPRMGERENFNRKTGRRTIVSSVYVGREWICARMKEEFAYRLAFYEWYHGTEPKGRAS